MRISDAQRGVRSVFLGGFVGQLVSGSLWLVSAALGTWSSPRHGILLPFCFFCGMREFGVLTAAMVGAGVATGLYLPDSFNPGGWFTAAALLLFAFIGRRTALRERPGPSA